MAKRKTQNWALFTTHYRTKRLLRGMTPLQYWARRGPHGCVVELPNDSTLLDAIEWARSHGVCSGDRRLGLVQVQGPAGIWWHVDGLGNLAVARMDQIRLTTWAELERDPNAIDNPLSRAIELHRAMARARAAAAVDVVRAKPGLTLAQLAAVDGCGSIPVADLLAAGGGR